MALGCRLVVAVLLVLTAACTTEARKTKAELTKEDRVRTILKNDTYLSSRADKEESAHTADVCRRASSRLRRLLASAPTVT